MRGFCASFRAQARDLLHHPLFWLGLVGTAVAAWIFGSRDPLQTNGYIVFSSAARAGARTASFFVLGAAAISVASDRTRGTVRWVLPRPVSRSGYVLGKGAALGLFALLLVLTCVTCSWLVARPRGFSDLETAESAPGFHFVEAQKVEPQFSAATMRRRTVETGAALLPALLTVAGVGLLVSCLLASASAAVILALAAAVLLTFLPEIAGLGHEAARALPPRAAEDLLDQLRQFGRMLSTAHWPGYGTREILGAVAGSVGLPLLGALVFARRNLTD